MHYPAVSKSCLQFYWNGFKRVEVQINDGDLTAFTMMIFV